MSTYYNYVRRGPESQVDWGKIGTDISTEITKISQDREAKRTELDKLGSDLIKSASQVTLPEQDYVKGLVLNGTNEMKNLALQQNKLLKQGKITPSQYRMVMENMKTNVDYLSKSVKDFNPSYKRDIDRLAKGEMSFEEKKKKEKLFNYGNLENKVMFVSADGNMYLTDIDKDGNPVANPDKMMSVGMLSQGLSATEPLYDVKADLDAAFKSIGSVTKIIRAGGVESEDSIKNNPQYTAARDSYISMMIDDRAQLVEIMGGYYGDYNVVEDKSKAGGKNIFFDSNGVFRPTDEQKEEIRKRLTNEFDAMVTIDRKGTAVFSPNTRLPKEDEEVEEGFTYLYETFIPGTGGVQVAEDAILAVGSDIDNVDKLNLVLRRIDPNITARAVDGPGTSNQIILSSPGVTPITIDEDDDTGLLDAIDQIRQQLYNAGAGATGGTTPSGGGSSR